jgi:hypothetical protein
MVFFAALVTVLALGPGEVKSVWSFGDDGGGVSWAQLRVERPVALVDEQPSSESVGDRAEWVRSTLPQIDFTVRNEGTKRITAGRVRIEVTNSERISSCELPQGAGGEIPIDRSFVVFLPVLPVGRERVIYRQLHQEVLPQRAARFKLYFRSLGDPLSENLLALRVSLIGDQGQRLEVGRFLLGLPGPVPQGGGYFLPETTTNLKTAREVHSLLASTWCFRRNLAVIRNFLSLPGERTTSMRDLSGVKPPPGWNELTDHRSPRRAIDGLLQSDDIILGPQLALFAAQQSGEPSLVHRTRRRASAALCRQARDWLMQELLLPERADVDARLARRMTPSAETQGLVERADAALRASESTREG